MTVVSLFAALALVAAPTDTVALREPESRPVAPAPTLPVDTVRPRPRAVEVSDAYELRLRIHRYASYTMVPLFVAQTVAGNQLYQSGGDDPSWALTMHKIGAGGLATLFTVNTVTGVWNLWESRSAPQGRTLRLVHAGLMLASDAGFTYAGVKLGPEATRSGAKRQQHKRVALISMSGALLGYGAMLFGRH